MKLSKENSGTTEATFLDMKLKIDNGTIVTELYDKRDSFGFSIIRMPYASSNIPSKMFYATISAEILRIGRATSNYSKFIVSIKTFLTRMIKQGAKISSLKNTLSKMLDKHGTVFSKYNKATQLISTDILNN